MRVAPQMPPQIPRPGAATADVLLKETILPSLISKSEVLKGKIAVSSVYFGRRCSVAA